VTQFIENGIFWIHRFAYGVEFVPEAAKFIKNISAQILDGPVILNNGIGGYLMGILFLHLVKNIRVISFLEGHDRRALEPVEDIFTE
jgi:hypothetical protein